VPGGKSGRDLTASTLPPGTLLGFSEIDAIVHQGEEVGPEEWLKAVLKAEKTKLPRAGSPGLLREPKGLFLCPGLPVQRIAGVSVQGVTFPFLLDLGQLNEAIEGTMIETIDSQTGDFTRDGGKSVMEGYIANYGIDGIDLVFAHNDDMGLGAIEAIEAAGGVPGEDIKIITIDAVADGMQALVDGKINYIVECNPLLGDLVSQVVQDVLAVIVERSGGVKLTSS